MPIAIFDDLLFVFGTSGLAIYAAQYLRVPPSVGLLLGGLLIGPSCLNIVRDQHDIELLAEIGVIVLLFSVGMELSLTELLKRWKVVVGSGGLQIALCVAFVLFANMLCGISFQKSLFFGLLVSLSSSAIVIRALSDRAEIRSPHGAISLYVLLFQDLAVVLFLAMIPLLAGTSFHPGAWLTVLLKAAAIVGGVVLTARYAVPPILGRVLRTQSRELSLAVLVVVCLGSAWISASAGLSLALGAFLAGIALSESEYSHHVMNEVMPFRDLFGGLFFVSLGMLVDLQFFAGNWHIVLSICGGVLLLKFLSVLIPTWLMGVQSSVAAAAALCLAQVGEFSFLLARDGLQKGLLQNFEYQLFVNASVILMGITPLLVSSSRRVGRHLGNFIPTRANILDESLAAPESEEPKKFDVIVVGYGVNGRNVSRALSQFELSHIIVELNPESAKNLHAKGVAAIFGDCTQPDVLRRAGIETCHALVVVISDALSTRRCVAVARKLNPKVTIIARTRFLTEIPELQRLGADEVVPEEFETSVEIFARVLRRFDVPTNKVQQMILAIRRDAYGMFRSPDSSQHIPGQRPVLPSLGAELVEVEADSIAARKTLGEIDLRARAGVSVVAVQRSSQLYQNPAADFMLEPGDQLYLLGSQDQVAEALDIFAGKATDLNTA